MEFLSALIAIIVIDLVLAGDNAIVIGLAARSLPKEQQKQAIIWGTVGAVIIRALATLAVVWLLKIPGVLAIGGVLLIGIAYKLLGEEKGHEEKGRDYDSLWSAIGTIVIADAVMGLDNVLAVAGAAHGSFLLVVLGLLISVPIVVWGSTIFVGLVERYSFITYIGAGVIAWTGVKMINHEPLLKGYFINNPTLEYGMAVLAVLGVLLLGKMKRRKEMGKSHLFTSIF